MKVFEKRKVSWWLAALGAVLIIGTLATCSATLDETSRELGTMMEVLE